MSPDTDFNAHPVSFTLFSGLIWYNSSINRGHASLPSHELGANIVFRSVRTRRGQPTLPYIPRADLFD